MSYESVVSFDFDSEGEEVAQGDGAAADDDEVVLDSQRYSTLSIAVVYCFNFSVPSVYFSVARSSGQKWTCEECWSDLFDQKDDFVGKISLESIPNQPRPIRMIRIHPCQTNSIMTGFKASNNRTRSILSVLLQPFYKFDPFLEQYLNKVD